MILLKFFTLCGTCYTYNLVIELTPETEAQQDDQYAAVIYNLTESQLGIENISCLVSCPASTPEEKQFNDEVSITGLGIFARNCNSCVEDITSEICEKPFQPAMVYNLESGKYEIGYELYYAQGKANLQNSKYSLYRRVNPNNEIINSTKLPSSLAVEYQDDNSTKFFNVDKSSTLIFHWIPELDFTYSGNKKQIKLNNENVNVPNDDLQYKCEDFIEFPEINIKIYLSFEQNPKRILGSAIPGIKNLQEWQADQSYGVLGLSQIIPLWYFRTHSAKLASCSHMNMVPVWKTIAGQLRKVDLYLQAVFRKLTDVNLMDLPRPLKPNEWKMKNVIFGVSDVSTPHPETSHYPNSRKAPFSSPDPHRRQLIPIPKIIYRIIQGGCYDTVYSAVIVIHNDPNNVSDSDRICSEEEEIGGWEFIENDDVKTGLTYVCPYRISEVIHDKLTIPGDDTYDAENPLELNHVRYFYSGGSEGGVIETFEDVTWRANMEFKYFEK